MVQTPDKRLVTELALNSLKGVANGLALLNASGQVVDAGGNVVAGGGLSMDQLQSVLSDELADYVTTDVLNQLLTHIPYFLNYNGTAWGSTRPAEAGTRQLIAVGGPVGPTFLNDTYRDFWIGAL